MARMTYTQARNEAITQLMEQDERIVVIGGYIGRPHRPAVSVPERLAHRATQVPIAELAYAGVAIGAAIAGLRPIVTFHRASFMFQALPQILNEAANYSYITAGQIQVPMVIHIETGITDHSAAQHCHSPQAMLWNTPGLEIIVPSTPCDVAGLLRTAVRRSCPVILAEHRDLYSVEGEVPEDGQAIPFGVADVKRPGGDVTIIATLVMVHRALEAAERLHEEGIEAAVVDPRTLVPLDKETIFRSVARTGRVVIADETHRSAGVAAGLASVIAEEAFDCLKAPLRIVATPDVPIPYSPPLEEAITPTADKIVAAARSIL